MRFVTPFWYNAIGQALREDALLSGGRNRQKRIYRPVQVVYTGTDNASPPAGVKEVKADPASRSWPISYTITWR